MLQMMPNLLVLHIHVRVMHKNQRGSCYQAEQSPKTTVQWCWRLDCKKDRGQTGYYTGAQEFLGRLQGAHQRLVLLELSLVRW